MILYLKGVNNNESIVEIYIYYTGGTNEVIEAKKSQKKIMETVLAKKFILPFYPETILNYISEYYLTPQNDAIPEASVFTAI